MSGSGIDTVLTAQKSFRLTGSERNANKKSLIEIMNQRR